MDIKGNDHVRMDLLWDLYTDYMLDLGTKPELEFVDLIQDHITYDYEAILDWLDNLRHSNANAKRFQLIYDEVKKRHDQLDDFMTKKSVTISDKKSDNKITNGALPGSL